MNSEYGQSGRDYLISYQDMIADRFVGRDEPMSRLLDILEYPKRGKEMPVVVVNGPPGSGKSWFICRFSQVLEERKMLSVALDLRIENTGSFPGGLIRLSRELKNRFSIKTRQFSKAHEVFARRFMGVAPEPEDINKGFFQDILDMFRGDSEEMEIEPTSLTKIYGETWRDKLLAAPLYEHFHAMALAMAEDIETELSVRKVPFVTLLLDGWSAIADRFSKHWMTLFDNSSRLLVVIANRGELSGHGVITISLGDFNEEEAKMALHRRGLDNSHGVARIIGATGGSPIGVSMAATLAEVINRSGDVIRSNSFDVPDGATPLDEYSRRIWEKLRESEKYVLASAIKASGIAPSMMKELFPKQDNFMESLINVARFFSFEPPFTEDSKVRVHRVTRLGLSELTRDIFLPSETDLMGRARRFIGGTGSAEWELLYIRLLTSIDPSKALKEATERVIDLAFSENYDLAESILVASEPKLLHGGLRAVHKSVAYWLLNKYFSPREREEFILDLMSDNPSEKGLNYIEYSRALADQGRIEEALRQLQDCVGMLSVAITNTTGQDPGLWFVRGQALYLAASLMVDTSPARETLSAARKASESLDRAISAGLDTAGWLSLQNSRSRMISARTERNKGDYRSAVSFLDKAVEALAEAENARDKMLPDESLLASDIMALRGDIHRLANKIPEAEEYLTTAYEGLLRYQKDTGIRNPGIELAIGNILLALADLLSNTGTHESAGETIRLAEEAFDRYEEMIGVCDSACAIVKAKVLLLKCNMALVSGVEDDIERAIEDVKLAEELFNLAISEGAVNNEAKLERIRALILWGELLDQISKDSSSVFSRAEKLLDDELSNGVLLVPLLKLQIELARSRGGSAFATGDYSEAVDYFSLGISSYKELHNLAPELPYASDVGELQLGTAIALRESGNLREALNSLSRAEDAYEIGADMQTDEGLKKVLHAAIKVYNDLASSGQDEEAFEAAIFVLRLAGQVGGVEVLKIGQELLIYWESQDLQYRDKRRLREAAEVLREQWGDY